MKIVFFFELSQVWQAALSPLQAEFPEVEFVIKEKRTEKDIAEADAFVAGMITPEQLGMAGALKVLFLTYTGPNFLPLQELADRGIRVANTHGNAQSVAERAVALTLSFYGKIIDYHQDLKNGKWHGMWGGRGLADTWDSLHGKRCALIGTGEIGKWIARFLKVFGCEVIGFKQRPVNGALEPFDEVTLDLDEALKGSELVFVSLPLTTDTEGMFDENVLSRMTGKFLVNVGRGAVIEEEALYNALKSGLLKGAGLDVWYHYPQPGQKAAVMYPSKFPFHELPNVVLSPHVAGLTPHAAEANVAQIIDNIRSFLKTGRPRFEIDSKLMY